MQRNEVMKILEDHMVHRGENRTEARSVLETYSSNELNLIYAKKVASGDIRPTGEQQPPQAPKATWADVERAKQEARAARQKQEIDFQVQRDLGNFSFQVFSTDGGTWVLSSPVGKATVTVVLGLSSIAGLANATFANANLLN